MSSEVNRFPPGWDEARVQRVIAHYEAQTEDEAVAEDEAAFDDKSQTVMVIPNSLVPAVRELLLESPDPEPATADG